jgi:hypothetical protein
LALYLQREVKPAQSVMLVAGAHAMKQKKSHPKSRWRGECTSAVLLWINYSILKMAP